MSYLLDTNTVIALLKDEPAVFRKRLRSVISKGAEVGVSSVTANTAEFARVPGLRWQNWAGKS